MLDLLAEKYDVVFEGLPEPVFYGRFYPMGPKEGPMAEELWDLFNYGRGLKLDKDPDRARYNKNAALYEADLRGLLNAVMGATSKLKRGVLTIPSSKRGVTNRVTELVRSVLSSNPGPFSDLTGELVRIQDKAAAHAGGSRSADSNMDTLALSSGSAALSCDVLLVLDDVITSGSSFRAVNRFLRLAGFQGAIVNFAFARTCPSEGAAVFLSWMRDPARIARTHADEAATGGSPLDALVLDFDQTLVDDAGRDPDYERNPGKGPCPYAPYPGISRLMGLGIPWAVVSNRPLYQLGPIIADGGVSSALYPANPSGNAVLGRLEEAYLPREDPRVVLEAAGKANRNVFSFPAEDSSGYTVRHYKPSPRGVSNAIEWLGAMFPEVRDRRRILGIGNTLEDIAAYRAAGIQCGVALWGIPRFLWECASRKWGPDCVFETPGELADWCLASYGHCGRAIAMTGDDPERAAGYYELALDNDRDVACAANNLGLIIESKDRERAMELFERAIAAGSERCATANLADLIRDSDRSRAIELYRRSANQGNNNARAALARMIYAEDRHGAVELCEAAVADGDVNDGAFMLAWLLEGTDRQRSMELYQRCIDAGFCSGAARNLGNMLIDEDPERAENLIRTAIDSGDHLAVKYLADLCFTWGRENEAIEHYRSALDGGLDVDFNNYGVLMMSRDRQAAAEVFRKSIADGHLSCASCNLGHLLFTESPEEAKALYRQSLENEGGIESTEALIGLSLLLGDSDEARARELVEMARARENFPESIEFMAEYFGRENPDLAETLRQLQAG